MPVFTRLSSNQGSLCAGKDSPVMYDRQSEGQYTVLTLEQLLRVNQLVNLITLLESTTAPHMSCDTNRLLNI